MTLDRETIQVLKDFNRNVAWLKQRELKDSRNWCKASKIFELTGWDRFRLRDARKRGEIVWKKDSNGFFYDPSSLNEVHIKKQTA